MKQYKATCHVTRHSQVYIHCDRKVLQYNYTETLLHLQHGAFLHKDHQQMSRPFFPNIAHHSNFGCHWQLLTQWILYTYWKHSHQLHRNHHTFHHFQLPTHIWNLELDVKILLRGAGMAEELQKVRYRG